MLDAETKARKREEAKGVVGVFFDEAKDKFIARFKIDKRSVYVGSFETVEEAAQAYQGEKAKTRAAGPAQRRQGTTPAATPAKGPARPSQAAQRPLGFRPAERSGLTPAQVVELRQRCGFDGSSVGVNGFNAFLQAESVKRGITIGPLAKALWGETMDPEVEFV